MANEKHLARLRAGVDTWNAWRKEHPDIAPDLRKVNLSGADLIRVDLREADLREADLHRTNLIEADLSRADLSDADLSDAHLSHTKFIRAHLNGAHLIGAKLIGAYLSSAHLEGAYLIEADLRYADLDGAHLSDAHLSGANLFGATLIQADLNNADLDDADFRQARLIHSYLDGANLSGAKLWDIQHGDWSIKDVICQRAFWDRDGKEPTEYGVGDFERIFAEKPRIVLRYPGGLSPVELAMLPLIVERLQLKHPDCALHIRSVQDEGCSAVVTITVDDLAGRTADALNTELVRVRDKLECVVEERNYLRQRQDKPDYFRQKQIMELFSQIIDKISFSPQETHFHGPIAQVTIEGTAMSRDTYNISGQAGAVGPKAHAHDMTFQQIQNSLDLPKLAEELGRLCAAMRQETEGTREQDKAIAAVAEAEESASKGDASATLRHLKTVGKWTLGIAEKICLSVAADAIKKALGPLAGL